jgi:hypothetical protein
MIFLMYISFLFLILAEIFDEVLNGDKHDLNSQFKLATIFIGSQIFGLIAGYNFGFIVYGLIRLALFDLIFGKMFKNDWFYLGSTSKWDKFIYNIPNEIVLGFRILALIMSIIIII